MADIFSTSAMLAAVDSLIAPPQFLLDRFFPKVQAEASEEIHFDILEKTRRLAPFVSPVVAGKVMTQNGVTTKTFKPAYVKPKFVFNPRRPLKRVAGEPIGGNLNPAQRIARALVEDLIALREMTERRMEVMAAEALLTGAVTVSGEQYPTQYVDFGRDPALTFAKPEPQKWSNPAVSPLDDLEDWAQVLLQKTGARSNAVVMPVDVWIAFRRHPQIENRLNSIRGNSTLQPNAQMAEGAVYMGNVDGFDIYVYAGWYLDDNDIEQPIIPPGKLILSGAGLEGVRAYGAIEDFDANLQAVPFFPKSWQEGDPSVRYLLMQSAPLVVPARVNASLCATVL